MEITAKLIEEHMVILKGVGYLKLARKTLETCGQPPVGFFENAIPFFRNYTDKYHHYKEEYLMFGFLARKKDGAIDLEIGSLRHEHEIGRMCIKEIENSLPGYSKNSEIAIAKLLKNLSSFISILTRHIYKEDRLFFPMVEKELSPGEKQVLGEQFDKEEASLGKKAFLAECMENLEQMGQIVSGN